MNQPSTTSAAAATGLRIAITRRVPTPTGAAPTSPAGLLVEVIAGEGKRPREEVLRFIRGASSVVTMFDDRVDAEFLDAAGPSLRGVCNFAVGVDNIDLTLCASRGIGVSNTPDAVTEGTANIALGLLLSVARRIGEGDRFVRAGRFEREGNGFPGGWLGMDLAGRTLLIVGAGRIGKAVAQRCLALGMRVIYAARNRHIDFELAPLCAERVELDDGLRRADVVSLHTPLTSQTKHLIDERRLRLMKPQAILINTARGPVVDESALVKVLREGHLFGAGLDVFEREPTVHDGLLTLENVVLTPHIGSAERRWRWLMTEMVIENASRLAQGLPASNPVV